MMFDRDEAAVTEGVRVERVHTPRRLGGIAFGGFMGYSLADRLAVGVDVDALIRDASTDDGFSHGAVAVTMKCWPTSHLWVAGGLGKGTLAYPHREPPLHDDYAIATSVSSGFEIIQRRQSAMDVQLKLSTARYEALRVGNVSMHLGWEHFGPF